MRLTDAERIARKLIKKHCPGWKFKFDNARARLGCCNHSTNTITISRYYVIMNDEAIVKDTILHEIAHACVGLSHGHDRVWKNKARELGCMAVRCKDGSKVNGVEGRFKYRCKSCGFTISFHKRLKRKRACGNCCDHFNPDYLMEGDYL